MTPEIRSALYAILAAISTLIVAYGLMSQDQATHWLTLAVTILNAAALLLARRHVPDAPDAQVHDELD
ncbi:MAG: hypothetical protein Q4G35_03200 [Propionibacteriaceae bacterium]|nr:hypothetical protein [Propionibacteriaceae bacterium]